MRFARLDHPLMHARAFIGGQQRGMDIDQPAFPGAREAVGQDAHETGQADDLHVRGAQGRVQFGVEILAALAFMRNDFGGDAGVGRALQTAGVLDIGNHQHDPVGRIRLRGYQRAEIAASARDQDADFLQSFSVPR